MRATWFIALLLLPLAGRADDVFKKDVLPVLRKNCFGCHGPEKQKGKLRLDTLSLDFDRGEAAERWHDALNKLSLGEMPPEDKPQLSREERRAVTGWLRGRLEAAARARRSTGGRVVLRRLTRYEYANTLRDLLGLDLDFARELPPEPKSADGFKNNGGALGMSAEQLEYYLQIARDAFSKAIVEGERPEVVKIRVEKSSPVRRIKGEVSNLIAPGGQFLAKLDEFPREGDFVVRVRATAVVPRGAGWPRLRVALGVRADVRAPQKTLALADVKGGGEQLLEFRGRIENFPLPGHNPKFPGLLVRLVNEYDDGSGFLQAGQKKKKKKNSPKDPALESQPKIEVHSVEFEGPLFSSWPPASHTRLLGKSSGSEEDRARLALERFMPRAWRRPVTTAEVGRMLSLFTRVRPDSPSFEVAMRDTLALVLVTPEFLYLVEPAGEKGSRALDDGELASRLSYFLWSTMPDETLFSLAKAGKLRAPGALGREVKRMLADERSWEFVQHFTDQWLNLSGLKRVAVNPQFHPNFDDRLKNDMRLETQHFFSEILRSNSSALQFIDSKFAMLNRPLAAHYGLEGPRGNGFERVALKSDQHRGGLLTQGSILLANSDGEQSHPIRRAVWLLDRLLGSPPAPPPPDVPELDSEIAKKKKLSIRQQMELHRKKAACADCHSDIDPWGISFEEYDAVGKWRREWRQKPKSKPQSLDLETKLPGGHKLKGMQDLKRHLLSREKDRFARALSEKILTYALGRSLEFTDEETTEALARGFKRSGYHLRDLITQVVETEAFRTK